MGRALRIHTRGWQGTAMSHLTFGYYAGAGGIVIPPIIADWCISDGAQWLWTIADKVLNVWTIADETRDCP